MLIKLIVLGVGGLLALFGWDEFGLAYNNSEPTKMTCSNFLADSNKPKWVSVDDCVIFLGKFEYSHLRGSESIGDAGVLVFASKKDALSDSSKTSVAMQVSNEKLMKEASQNIDSFNKINARIDEIVARLESKSLPNSQRQSLSKEGLELSKEKEKIKESFFMTGPMVFKFSSERPSYDLIKDSLSDDYSVYEISSLEDKPSYFMAVLKMIGGLLLLLGILYSFIPGSKQAEA